MNGRTRELPQHARCCVGDGTKESQAPTGAIWAGAVPGETSLPNL